MDNYSISDILWNLKSAFQEVNFTDAEHALIKREQELKKDKFEIESNYNTVLKENKALKKQCDKLRLDAIEKSLLKKSGNAMVPGRREEFDGLSEKIRCLQRENATIRARADTSEGREREVSEKNAELLDTIKEMEEEKEDVKRRERLMRGEINEHMQTILSLKKEIATVRKRAEMVERREVETREENVRVSGIIEVMETEKDAAVRREKEVRGKLEKHLQKIECLEKEIATIRGRAETVESREKDAREGIVRVSDMIKAMKEEKENAVRREIESRGEIAKHLQRIGCLEKEIATGQGRVAAESTKAEVGEENKRLLDMIMDMENEKEEAEKREKELKGEIKKNLQKIESLEKEKATIRGRAETAERRETETGEENTRLLQKIECLEKDKEKASALAEAESAKKICTRLKNKVDTLTEDPGLNLSSAQARLSLAYDAANADVEDRLDTNIEEESHGQHSKYSSPLSEQKTNLSPLFCGKHTTTPVIEIIDSDNDDDDDDDEGVNPINGVKRKRESSESSSTRVVDDENDAIVSRKRNSVPSGNARNASRSTTAVKCSDEEARVVASWEFEADMLEAFDKDPVLTMEAICTLYRQQRSVLPYSKTRGFFGILALRGTILAEFLLDRNAEGSMKKTLEELQLHDPKGLDDCKKIASSHSKQLFEIYQRQADPFFGPK